MALNYDVILDSVAKVYGCAKLRNLCFFLKVKVHSFLRPVKYKKNYTNYIKCYFLIERKINVELAEWVERRTMNRDDPGSSPEQIIVFLSLLELSLVNMFSAAF